jgi:molybdate transport system substrate-binding protein
VSPRGVLPAIGLLLLATACGSDSGATSSNKVTGTITVSAAASLTDAFHEIGTDFKKANPRANVTFNFGSSATLATQIRQGAPADVFASADQTSMGTLTGASLVDGTPTVFAKNRLVIVTKPGNPKQVKGLADLATIGVVSLCGETVPCGRYAAQILRGAGVTIPTSRITRGQDVKATLGAVATGDADAGIVYATDARAARDAVGTVTIPDAQNAIAVYPIAVVRKSGKTATARAFVGYVSSPNGQATLGSFGFLPPS